MSPAVRLWCFVVSLAALLVVVTGAVMDGLGPLRVFAGVSCLVALTLVIARPYVFKDGPS